MLLLMINDKQVAVDIYHSAYPTHTGEKEVYEEEAECSLSDQRSLRLFSIAVTINSERTKMLCSLVRTPLSPALHLHHGGA